MNEELKRCNAIIGIFPNRQAVLRLFSALFAEQNDEWLAGHRSFSEGSLRKPAPVGGPGSAETAKAK